MNAIQATVDGFPQTRVEVEMLAPPVGRVLDASMVFNTFADGNMVSPILTNDLVRLSHEPGGNELPRVVEVLTKGGPRQLSKIVCRSHQQVHRTIAISAVLGSEIQVITEDMDHEFYIWVKHDKSIHLKRLVELAGLTRPSTSAKSGLRINTQVPIYSEDQKYRLIALAVVLGTEVKAVLYTDEEIEDETAAIGEVIIEHVNDIDFLSVAIAAGITPEPSEDLESDPEPRTGAVPGPEWESGAWGSFDSDAQKGGETD